MLTASSPDFWKVCGHYLIDLRISNALMNKRRCIVIIKSITAGFATQLCEENLYCKQNSTNFFRLQIIPI